MKTWNVAAIVLASVCVWTGCKTGQGARTLDAPPVEGPAEIKIIEPEGINLSDVVAAHGINEFSSAHYYGTDQPVDQMRLYRHRWVELDGEAPAEVILTMMRKDDLDMLAESEQEVQPYMNVIHYVYSFKEEKTGTFLGSFAIDLMNPYSMMSMQITPMELDQDGRQELLLRDETAYYMNVQLFELREGDARIQDVIWSEPQARSFIPFDHDGDGSMELMAFPSSDVLTGLMSWGVDQPKEPFMLARDAQGFWHEQPVRRPYGTWAGPLLKDYLARTTSPSFFALDSIKTYSQQVNHTFPDAVYEDVLAYYQGLTDPFEQAQMIASMPVKSPSVVRDVCAPVLAASDSLELKAGCFAALAGAPDEANRDMILEFYGEFSKQMAEYPQLHPLYYQVQKFTALPQWVSRSFEQAKDKRFLAQILDRATEDLNDQNYYMRISELYPLMQWSYEDDLATHRFVLDVFFARLRDAIKGGQGMRARVLFDPLNTTALGTLIWYYQELERQKKGEKVNEETLTRGREAEAMWKEQLPSSLIEPLIGSSDPQMRILAIHYFSTTDSARFVEIFRTRVGVERDEQVRQELFGRLYSITDDKTLGTTFWKAQILTALRSTNQQDTYTAYNMLPYFMAQATPADIVELWDETTSDDFKQQLTWQLQTADERKLSDPSWRVVRERVVTFFKQTTNANHRSGMMYILQNMNSPEIVELLRDSATKEQEIYVVQGALTALATLKDEQTVTLLKLRESELREQPYIYASVLGSMSEHMPVEATPLIIKELQSQDPTKPLESQLLWTVGGMMYREGQTIPKEIVSWFEEDIQAGLEVDSTSCVRLGQQVMVLFLAGDEAWERRLEKVEAHPGCKAGETPYVARKFAVDAAISMSHQPTHSHSKLLSFIRQHHDFPYRPIRVSVVQFEAGLKAEAEEKKKQQQSKAQTP